MNWRWVEEGDGYVGRLQPHGQPLGVGLPSGLQCLVPYPYRNTLHTQAAAPQLLPASLTNDDGQCGIKVKVHILLQTISPSGRRQPCRHVVVQRHLHVVHLGRVLRGQAAEVGST